MRYLMRQKILAFGDDFTVQDEDGRDLYYIDGKALSIGDQLSVQNMDGKELAYVRQKLLSWGPTYEIYRDGDLRAVIKKELFTLFKCRFTIDEPGPDDMEATGDFLDHEYELTRDGEPVARISKRWFSFSDTYGIDVAADEDPVLVIASAIAIDLACHKKDD